MKRFFGKLAVRDINGHFIPDHLSSRPADGFVDAVIPSLILPVLKLPHIRFPNVFIKNIFIRAEQTWRRHPLKSFIALFSGYIAKIFSERLIGI